jgi:outer membrane receptor protein involved in Fe transport
VQVRGLGQENLSPEVMHSYEVGYRGLWGNRLKTDATVFYYDLKDPIALIAGAPALIILAPAENKGAVYAIGYELSTELFVAPWCNLFANYTFQDLEREDGVLENDVSPPHKLNTGVAFTWKHRKHACLLDLFSHFVGTVDVPAGGAKMTPYTLINGRLAYAYDDLVECSLAAYNIGHDIHREVPAAQDLGTRLLFKTSVKF